MHRKNAPKPAYPKTSTSRRVTAQLSESKSAPAAPEGVSLRAKIAIGATVACGVVLTAAYGLTRQSDISPYTITCTNPPLPINETDLDFRIADQFKDMQEFTQAIAQVTDPALFTGATLYMKDAIMKEMPCLVSAAVYNWLEKPITCIFAKKEMYARIDGSNPEAATLAVPKGASTVGQMLFTTPGDLMKQRILTPIVRNEAFHLVCVQANSVKTIDNNLLTLPFLNQFGEIDLFLKTNYFDAIEEFKTNLNAIDSIVNKSKKLSEVERTKLKNANDALQDYQPQIAKHVVSKEMFRFWKGSLNKKLEVGTIIPKANSLGPLAQNKASVIEAIVEKPDGTVEIFYSNYGKSKAEIFAADYQQLKNRIFTAKGYEGLDEDHQNMEFGSDINMLPLRAKQHFASKFCKHMGEYLGVGQHKFCEVATPRPR